MGFQLGAQGRKGALGQFQIGVALAVDADHPRQQLGDQRQFLAQPLVVNRGDVVAKLPDARLAPVALLDGVCRDLVPLEGFEQLAYGSGVEAATLACRRQALPPAAAVVEAQALEEACADRALGGKLGEAGSRVNHVHAPAILHIPYV